MQIRKVKKEIYNEVHLERNGHPLQAFSWGELKKPNWNPIRLGVFEKSKCISVVSILQRSIPLYGKTFGYVPRGIVVQDEKLLSEVIRLLTEHCSHLTHLLIDLDIDFQNNNIDQTVNVFKNVGFIENGLQIQPNRTVVLNLSKDEEVLLKDMRSKHRQYIRKAEREGVDVRFGTDSDLADFCRIIREIGKEKGYVLHTCDYYRKVWELFRENSELLVSKYKGRTVGAYMVLMNKSNVYEMYGGCNKVGNAKLANYLMKWKAIKHSKAIGKKYYDQWGAEFKYPGLVQFKEGFGGNIAEYPPQLVYVNDKIGFNIFKIFDKLNQLRQQVY